MERPHAASHRAVRALERSYIIIWEPENREQFALRRTLSAFALLGRAIQPSLRSVANSGAARTGLRRRFWKTCGRGILLSQRISDLQVASKVGQFGSVCLRENAAHFTELSVLTRSNFIGDPALVR